MGLTLLNKGFSLLEIILTMMVLSIGTLSLIQAINTVVFPETQINHRGRAVLLAQEKMEEIKNAQNYSNIDNLASARVNLGGEFADFEREVVVNGDPKEVRVYLYWGPAGGEQYLRLVTLMADYNF